MTYEQSAQKAHQAAAAARAVQESTDDPSHRGLAEAIALIADALEDMAQAHHRQF
jgi:hypothetical protein